MFIVSFMTDGGKYAAQNMRPFDTYVEAVEAAKAMIGSDFKKDKVVIFEAVAEVTRQIAPSIVTSLRKTPF